MFKYHKILVITAVLWQKIQMYYFSLNLRVYNQLKAFNFFIFIHITLQYNSGISIQIFSVLNKWAHKSQKRWQINYKQTNRRQLLPFSPDSLGGWLSESSALKTSKSEFFTDIKLFFEAPDSSFTSFWKKKMS